MIRPEGPGFHGGPLELYEARCRAAAPYAPPPPPMPAATNVEIPSGVSGPAPAVVRQWLRDNGHDVGSRGRLSAAQFQLYHTAH